MIDDQKKCLFIQVEQKLLENIQSTAISSPFLYVKFFLRYNKIMIKPVFVIFLLALLAQAQKNELNSTETTSNNTLGSNKAKIEQSSKEKSEPLQTKFITSNDQPFKNQSPSVKETQQNLLNQQPFPSSSCCSTTHNIFIVDRSDSIRKNQFDYHINRFLYSHFYFTDFMSLAFFGGLGILQEPYYTEINVQHENIPNGRSIAIGSGRTIYDDAIILGIQLIGKKYVDRTIVIFVSSGIHRLKDLSLVGKFNEAKEQFQKKTGCKIEVKCYLSRDQQIINVKTFVKMCQQMGATNNNLIQL